MDASGQWLGRTRARLPVTPPRHSLTHPTRTPPPHPRTFTRLSHRSLLRLQLQPSSCAVAVFSAPVGCPPRVAHWPAQRPPDTAWARPAEQPAHNTLHYTTASPRPTVSLGQPVRGLRPARRTLSPATATTFSAPIRGSSAAVGRLHLEPCFLSQPSPPYPALSLPSHWPRRAARWSGVTVSTLADGPIATTTRYRTYWLSAETLSRAVSMWR